jgi:hypothetical protein
MNDSLSSHNAMQKIRNEDSVIEEIPADFFNGLVQDQAHYTRLLALLEGVNKVARQMRIASETTVFRDMPWLIRCIDREVRLLPIIGGEVEAVRGPLSELLRLMPMLAIADEEQVSILEELSLMFQLRASELFLVVSKQAAAEAHRYIRTSLSDTLPAARERTGRDLVNTLDMALMGPNTNQIGFAEARVATLQMAYEECRLTLRLQGALRSAQIQSNQGST